MPSKFDSKIIYFIYSYNNFKLIIFFFFFFNFSVNVDPQKSIALYSKILFFTLVPKWYRCMGSYRSNLFELLDAALNAFTQLGPTTCMVQAW